MITLYQLSARGPLALTGERAAKLSDSVWKSRTTAEMKLLDFVDACYGKGPMAVSEPFEPGGATFELQELQLRD